jgi:molybdenum cofactor cytidylyltransferase
MTAAGILLAAGLSTRMGSPKALLDWRGMPLVAYQVQQMTKAGLDPVVVVVGHEGAAVAECLRSTQATIVMNVDYTAGRATSVRAGALALSGGIEAILLLNVDQPRHAETLAALIDAHAELGGAITAPVYDGRRGHPIVIAGRLLGELQCVSDETEGLRALTRRHRLEREEAPLDAPEIFVDLNDPAAYHSALETWTL